MKHLARTCDLCYSAQGGVCRPHHSTDAHTNCTSSERLASDEIRLDQAGHAFTASQRTAGMRSIVSSASNSDTSCGRRQFRAKISTAGTRLIWRTTGAVHPNSALLSVVSFSVADAGVQEHLLRVLRGTTNSWLTGQEQQINSSRWCPHSPGR
jgi:hypothetical protein